MIEIIKSLKVGDYIVTVKDNNESINRIHLIKGSGDEEIEEMKDQYTTLQLL